MDVDDEVIVVSDSEEVVADWTPVSHAQFESKSWSVKCMMLDGMWICKILGPVCSEARPRAVRRGSNVHVFSPSGPMRKKIADAVRRCGDLPSQEQLARDDAKLEISISCVFPRPQSHFNKAKLKRLIAKKTTHHKDKPDSDNIQKFYLDMLQAARCVLDDKDVSEVSCRKRWAKPGDPAQEEVTIEMRISFESIEYEETAASPPSK